MNITKEILSLKDDKKAVASMRFFKTGKGQYAEHEKFLGLTMPMLRKIAQEYHQKADLSDIQKLLDSKWYEFRMIALVMLTLLFEKANPESQKEIYDFYLDNTRNINNWDLVDVSCHKIIGKYLLDKDRTILYALVESKNLWEQRIAIVSNWMLIRHNDLQDIFPLAEKLLHHPHDLMHKAVGWMLREAGKKDMKKLEDFLEKHAAKMPRTTLRACLKSFW